MPNLVISLIYTAFTAIVFSDFSIIAFALTPFGGETRRIGYLGGGIVLIVIWGIFEAIVGIPATIIIYRYVEVPGSAGPVLCSS